MRFVHRLALLAVVAAALPALAAPRVGGTPFPLSCIPPARPLVFEAWHALSLSHAEEAKAALQRALNLDPDCVLARATLATVLVGPRAQALFDDALRRAKDLAPLEQLELERLAAQREGDLEAAHEAARQQAALAPEDYFVHLQLAHAAQAVQQWEEAVDAARVAISLTPSSAAGWNILGYAHLRAGRKVDALTALNLAVDAAPLEPNAWDSLGEGLLAAGRPIEAAQAFQKALDLSKGRFSVAWQGLAAVQALEGDWPAARAALAAQRLAARQPQEQLEADLATAWTFAAEGRLSDALRRVNEVQREARRRHLDALGSQAAVTRAQLLELEGKDRAALDAWAVAGRLSLPGATRRQQLEHRGRVLTGRTVTLARLGRLRDARRSLDQLRAFLREELTGPFAGDAVAYAHGAVSLAAKRPREAIDAWLNCAETFDLCRLELLEAQRAQGDEGAAATEAALLAAFHRDPAAWLVRARVEARRRVSGT